MTGSVALRVFCVLSLMAGAASAENRAVMEAPRDIPLAYDVDVVVVGGTSAAVTAAAEAARAGAKVFLAAPNAYLGEDLCGTYRLWLEPGEDPVTPLAKALFAPPPPACDIGEGMPFSYEASLPSAGSHKDKQPPALLADGVIGRALNTSVQFDGDVTLTLDLGKQTSIAGVHVFAFQRPRDFEVKAFTVATSPDGQAWTEAAEATNNKLGQGVYEEGPLHIGAPLSGAARYLRLNIAKTKNAGRILLGEVVVEGPASAPAASGAGRIPPMPMQVKRLLDEELLSAGVPFLYGCYPSDILLDEAGDPAGIVIANKAGRQAIRAKIIIDATPRAAVARMAGATFTPFTPGVREFKRIVVGGEIVPGTPARTLPAPVQIEPGGWTRDAHKPAYEYTLSLPLDAPTFAAYAAADQAARDKTWHHGQVGASETIWALPPTCLAQGRNGKRLEAWTNADGADIDAFQPADVNRLYILGACAAVSPEAAAKMTRPLACLDLGARIGRAAADEARALAPLNTVTLPALPAEPANVAPGDVRENLAGARVITEDTPAVHAAARALPVWGEYDVVVIGGGTGGAPAAISAARAGAKTLVVEYLSGLGGVGTLGLIGTYYYGYREGFTAEMDKAVARMDGGNAEPASSWNVEWKMEWYRRELRKAGADIWFGAAGCGAIVQDGRVTGAVIATPDGRGAVLAKSVIDATGNADIACAAGAPAMTTGAGHVAVQGTGMPPRRPGAHYTNTDYTITNDSDMKDIWRTLVAGRHKYSQAYDLGQIVDSRERRRILGEYVVSPLDVYNHRTYTDSIGVSASNFDTHGFTVHAFFALQFPDKEEVQCYTPYRALLPKGLDGILVTGLAVSAHRDSMPILRMQPDIQNQGYAAGHAAAMAAKQGKTVRTIDIKALQRHLAEVGIVPESVLTDVDSPPLPAARLKAAITNVADNYRDVSLLLAQPGDALPLLRNALLEPGSPDAQLKYAHILGMLRDPAGAAILARTVAAQPWDTGWSFTGSGQFGGSLSPMDSYIVALGRTGTAEAAAPIIEKVAALDSTAAFSHHRAVAIACETLGAEEAAPALAALLAKPDMTGYACPGIAEAKTAAELASPNADRDRSLRELILARALYRCGDHQGVGEKILRQYAQDLRGHLAMHARAVLSENTANAVPETYVDPLDIECSPKK